MNNKTILLVEDFHAKPYGRYRDDCTTCPETSGQTFREDMLAADLREYDQVTVDLTGYNRYGRSFLDEGFGALIRKSGFIKAELDKKLIYKHDHLTSVITIIDERIREAEADRLARL